MPNRELEFSDKEENKYNTSKDVEDYLNNVFSEPMILDPEKGINKAEFINTVSKNLGIGKVHVATGRKAGRSGKTFREALKFQQWKIKLTDMRDLVNEVEGIIDEVKNLNHPMYSNTAIVYLYPTGRQFLEEHYLQANLRKIQGIN